MRTPNTRHKTMVDANGHLTLRDPHNHGNLTPITPLKG